MTAAPDAALPMHPALAHALARLRARRGFDAATYVRAKAALLDAYARRAGIRACVVGVSGGVDSALALALVARAARTSGSPIARVVAALVPMFATAGATHQPEALARGREVAAAMGAEVAVVDLTASLAAVRGATERALAYEGGAWATGQLVSYLRTPALYHLTALLTEQGLPALLVGTTNRDEGSYLGFFGKASDGMVDLQLVSDAHKSEVYAAAARLGVPASVLAAAPTGDTFDGRTDAEMIGASYDAVEFYGLFRSLLGPDAQAALRAELPQPARAQLDAWTALFEARHAANAHKYIGDSPAVHLDVYPRVVPGGWRAASGDDDRHDAPPAPAARARFVGEFALAPAVVAAIAARAPLDPPARAAPPLLDYGESAFVLDGVLADDECDALAGALADAPRVPVGRNGMLAGFDPARGDAVGSYRASAYAPELARALWARLAGAVPMARVLDAATPTDGHDHPAWRAVGVNPLFRFIEYLPGGELVPHYDAGFDFGDGRRHTLASVVLYLTDAPADERAGGATRLLLERQRHLPAAARAYHDGEASAPPRDVLARVTPRRGAALVFDHRVPHDVAPWRGPGARVVLRTDIVYSRCGAGALAALPPAPAPPADARRDTPDARAAPPPPRLLAKLLRDPYYGPALPLLGSLGAAEHAGFFDDGGPAPGDPDDDAAVDALRAEPNWLVTPLDKARARLDALLTREAAAADVPTALAPLAVLVTTGALCPVHRGHLAMMEHARRALEARGTRVLAGYLAPDHDAYVLPKCGGDVPGAAHRVRLCEQAVAGSDWLAVDPWAALHVARAVNFTDVLARLERYLAAHLRCARPVELVCVFGSDNARFALAFAARGRAVCVPRPGYDDRLAQIAAHPLVRDNPRVVMLDPREDAAAADAASSTAVRAGDDAPLAPAVRATWRGWRAAAGGGAGERDEAPAVVSVRDEGDWAIAPWLAGRDAPAVRAARGAFHRGLLAALARAFAEVSPPDAPRRVRLETRALEAELARASEAALVADGAGDAASAPRVLSLDPCVPGALDLRVSRCFELASGAARPGLVARPGAPPLAEQLAALPAGEYVLLDDDESTGRTLAAVRALLPPRCAVRRVVTLCATSGAAPLIELLDARDFLAGAREAGLVVALPDGALARVPYALPYARPADRVSAPVSSELAFSREVWALNLAFFDAVRPALRVADAAPAFRALCDYLGFDGATPLAQIARWHLARMDGRGG